MATRSPAKNPNYLEQLRLTATRVTLQSWLSGCLDKTSNPRSGGGSAASLQCSRMSPVDDLNKRLRELEAEFDREMRIRGFDPAQAENVALPTQLATLYAERERIRAQIEESEGKSDD